MTSTSGISNLSHERSRNGYQQRNRPQADGHTALPWEDAYGYAQAVRVGDTVHVAGQLAHDAQGKLIAQLDGYSEPVDFSNSVSSTTPSSVAPELG